MTTISLDSYVSPRLQQLIQEANQSIQTVKEKILAAYNFAIEVDKLTPKTAAKILREKLDFSDRYIREVLPLEAKELKFANKSTTKNDDNDEAEPVPPPNELQEQDQENSSNKVLEESEQHKVDITTVYDIKKPDTLAYDDQKEDESLEQIENPEIQASKQYSSCQDITNINNPHDDVDRITITATPELEIATITITPSIYEFCNPYSVWRYGRGEYGVNLHRFMNMWYEMKKTYNEMIELQLQNYPSYNIDDARTMVESDFKAFKLQLPDNVADYIHKYFIDKKTREYLKNKYQRVEYEDPRYSEWHKQFESGDETALE